MIYKRYIFMAKGNSKEVTKEKKPKFDLSDDIKHSILGIVFIALGIIATLSIFDLGGRAGEYLIKFFDILFGVGTYIVPGVLFLVAAIFLLSIRANIYFSNYLGAGLIFLSLLGLLDLMNEGQKVSGYVGFIITYPLQYLFGFWATGVILIAVLAVSMSLCLNISFKLKKREKGEKEVVDGESLNEEKKEVKPEKAPAKEENRADKNPDTRKEEKGDHKEEKGFMITSKERKELEKKHYPLPPFDILEPEKGNPSAGDIKAYAHIIKRTLGNFGIEVEMGEINIGPTVTQYTFKPAQGVKLSSITALQNDLALALAAHPIRIEAPIPGRSLVGIEMPNKAVAMVRLRNLIETSAFLDSPLPLLIALGKDVSGNPIYVDLAKMPHILIAGATGTGKSVGIHSIISGFLFKNYPDLVKFIIIDPKRVELACYNGIPHLLTPVIVDKDKAIASLRWAVREMERRYEVYAEAGARDITSYNNQARKKGEDIMNYIVVVIDELADLMMAYPREVEGSIVRIAQMARAVGIHLVISTQRPSVEVITGLIKANIVTRVAFQVASQVDSRTILDMAGAENLLGNGDMLYISSEYKKPKRIQGGFISEKEVKKLADYLKKAGKDETDYDDFEQKLKEAAPHSQNGGEGAHEDGIIDDDMYEEAKAEVIRMQKASASLLQRRLRVGYARAARLLDLLEEQGVIGPGDGAKPRKVMIKEDGTAAPSEEFGEEADEFDR
jgi:S-DNA-T family DNA segregation ATPase FtsK/SpoIIIE